MGVIHVISKYKDGDWKIANNDERGRSLAIANYRPIIHNDSADFHYVIISYGSRVEDYSKDTIYIKDTKAQIMKINKYFATQSNSNIYLKLLMLDADAPLIEQVKQLASYIDDCSKDEHVKSLHILGQSKCGVMNMYLPRYFNNPRSFEITNIYNLSTPYVGTLLASPLVFYPMVHEKAKELFGDNKFSEFMYQNGIKLYESISSNSHMDYDVAMNGGIPLEKLDRYDEDFIKNVFAKENIDALKQVSSFNNFTTRINKDAINNAKKVCDVVTVGLYLLDKWFFEEVSDGLVQTSDQHLVEDYLGIKSIDLSSSHMVAVNPEFHKVLDTMNEAMEKPLQRRR